MGKNIVDLRRVNAEDLIPRRNDKYVDTGIINVLDKLAWGRPLILKGPKGTGKTLSIEQWAAHQGVSVVRQDCTEDTGVRDLIGTFAAQGEDIFYSLGAVTTAIDIANEEGGCVLILEEVNALPPSSQKILNAVCDYRQEVSVPKIGQVFRVKPGHKIWVLGTMNPNYSGTYSLNQDFISRWGFIEVGYMNQKLEKQLLLDSFSQPPNATERNLVDGILILAAETRAGKYDYALSTRDLVHFIDDYERLGKPGALKVLEGKYDTDKVEDFQGRVMSVFNVNLKKVKLIQHV